MNKMFSMDLWNMNEGVDGIPTHLSIVCKDRDRAFEILIELYKLHPTWFNGLDIDKHRFLENDIIREEHILFSF